MGTLRDTLKRLFTRNVVTTHRAGVLKVFDVSKSQSTGAKSAKNSRHRWPSSGANVADGFMHNVSQYDIESARLRMYADYEIMDADAIIASALDIYADSATVNDANNQMLTIRSSDAQIKAILYNLFYDILNIEFNLWPWTRELCKYGDYFLYLDIKDEFGVVNVTPIHPSALQREESLDPDNAGEFRFKYVGNEQSMFPKEGIAEYEVAHFRLLSDTKYLPYGKSAIEPARREYKKLSLFEDAMLLQRIMRAPERRVYKIDIGNIAPEEVDGYVKDFINSVKKVPYIDPVTGDYNLKFNLQNMLEDFYLPVRGSDSGTSIDTLQGLNSQNYNDDVEYSKSKLLAALKIPKAWLGYDESIDGKANTAGLDIRFSSTIERIQKVITSELYKIALIHLVAQGIQKDRLMDFELSLSNSSTIRKRQEIDVLNEKMTLANSMLESKLFSRQYIYERIFDLSAEEWEYESKQVPEDIKEFFRYKQIEDEGNDPTISKRSFGTPHDLATLQQTSGIVGSEDLKKLYTQDERANNEGRPPEPGTFGKDSDPAFGRDPDGRKSLNTAASEGVNKHYLTNIDSIIKSLKRGNTEKSVVIRENVDELANLEMYNEHVLLDSEDQA